MIPVFAFLALYLVGASVTFVLLAPMYHEQILKQTTDARAIRRAFFGGAFFIMSGWPLVALAWLFLRVQSILDKMKKN